MRDPKAYKLFASILCIMLFCAMAVGCAQNRYKVLLYSDNFLISSLTDIISGTTINEPEEPQKSGYKFIGWYTAEGKRWNFHINTVTSDITLYAGWEALIGNKAVPFSYLKKTEPYIHHPDLEDYYNYYNKFPNGPVQIKEIDDVNRPNSYYEGMHYLEIASSVEELLSLAKDDRFEISEEWAHGYEENYFEENVIVIFYFKEAPHGPLTWLDSVEIISGKLVVNATRIFYLSGYPSSYTDWYILEIKKEELLGAQEATAKIRQLYIALDYDY